MGLWIPAWVVLGGVGVEVVQGMFGRGRAGDLCWGHGGVWCWRVIGRWCFFAVGFAGGTLGGLLCCAGSGWGELQWKWWEEGGRTSRIPAGVEHPRRRQVALNLLPGPIGPMHREVALGDQVWVGDDESDLSHGKLHRLAMRFS